MPSGCSIIPEVSSNIERDLFVEKLISFADVRPTIDDASSLALSLVSESCEGTCSSLAGVDVVILSNGFLQSMNKVDGIPEKEMFNILSSFDVSTYIFSLCDEVLTPEMKNFNIQSMNDIDVLGLKDKRVVYIGKNEESDSESGSILKLVEFERVFLFTPERSYLPSEPVLVGVLVGVPGS